MTEIYTVEGWLRDHCQVVIPTHGEHETRLRWPSGVTHTWDESRALVRVYTELGLEPTDIATSEMIDALVSRLVQLEKAVAQLTKETKG